MKKEELAEGIGQVEDKLVAEAGEKAAAGQDERQSSKERRKERGKQPAWRRWIAAAALAALAVTLGSPLISGGRLGVGLQSFFGGEKGGTGYQGLLVAQAEEPEGCEMEDYERLYEIREENPVEEELYAAMQDFSFRSMSVLAGSAEKSSNLLYSPFSLYYALALMSAGTEGTTREELTELLGASDTRWLAEQCGNLYRRLYRSNKQGTFQIASSLWMAEEWQGRRLDWKEDYLDTATQHFYASVFSADFTDADTGRIMGRWVAEQTGGLLEPELPTNEDQILAVLNTIYLKDEWRDCFQEEKTKEDIFCLADGEEVTCDYMNRITHAGFSRGEGYTRASLYLKQTGSVVFVLPDEGVSVEELLSSPERLEEAFTGGEDLSGIVTWQVPKFTFGMECELKELLQELGIQAVFEKDLADFSGMTEEASYLSQVRQGAKLSMNEKGVEAAAYTYLAVTGEGAPSKEEEAYMILNRPFLYGIQTGNTYTFLGVCQNPAIEE